MSIDQRPAGPRDAARATAVVARLLAATAAGDDDVAAVIDDLGAGEVADVVLAELLFRACVEDLVPAAGADGASVTVVFSHRGHDFSTSVAVTAGGVRVVPGELGAPHENPALTQELSEAVRALYGPLADVSATTRRIRWPGPEVVFPTPQRPSLPTVFYAVVQRLVQVLDRREPADLTELAVRYGTDKWGAMHQYPRRYETHFSRLRDRRLRILEIGVGGFDDPAAGGGSLRMWKRYFPRALVHGFDILDKSPLAEPRLTVIRGDQSDPADLAGVVRRHGPFDIVIDDGSHRPEHVLASFNALFPHVKPDGLYVIEDLMACYWPVPFGGSDVDLNDPGFTVGFLKSLLDGLHHEEFLRPDARVALPTDALISAVHVYHNLAVIEKGANADGSLVASMLRAQNG
ncbi:class I SAM-dependent methyltransferase [Actinoplanes sp. N902-109]|uniref:class I SAM-dependent methyltransferase n=1 Tax=Actinoplanes sp. (strain N902-109) TaxID=649831 RepID=UPI0003294D24|nr:class I SAM-dependent methyltransferase [Actinoplanes sp. N902-109]AGL18610.1 sugar O-methyltransferase [Actinoplanes sp. N902-109]